MSAHSFTLSGVPYTNVRRERARPLSPEERRDKLVDTTLNLLREHGRTVTTRQIAEAAGVAEGTIFRVVESKEELVELAITRAFEPGALVHRIEEIDPHQPLHVRLVQLSSILQQRFRATFELMKKVGMVRPPDHVHDSPEAVELREYVHAPHGRRDRHRPGAALGVAPRLPAPAPAAHLRGQPSTHHRRAAAHP